MGIPRDGTGINCYGMGMGQINMSHRQPCIFTIVSKFLLDLQLMANYIVVL